MKILIVKTSSLGDIIQCFPVLHYLHQIHPNVEIDWIVEEPFAPIVQVHPLVKRVIVKKFSSYHDLRKTHYQYVFDLQGNCKSGLITFLAKANKKIGFSFSSAREWPNILATCTRFSVRKDINIRLQYLSVFEQFFQKKAVNLLESYSLKSKLKQVMVAPGSKWSNKQLKKETLQAFLTSLEKKYDMCFLFVWGSKEEKEFCEEIKLTNKTILPSRLPIPEWQALMSEMDLVIAVDSSALHLCGTTKTPSFSVFGPTSAAVFKPLGDPHYAIQGKCPYGRVFLKQCPILRTCPTGACIKDISSDELLEQFSSWWEVLSKKELLL